MDLGSNANYLETGKALMRMTREMTLEEQGENCKKIEKGQNYMDAALGIAGVALGVFALFTMPMLIVVSSAVLVNVLIAKALTADENIERECADLPFKELDEKMKARQEETDRKIAEQNEILKEVNEKVGQTLDKIEDVRKEMGDNFQRVLNKIGDLDASNPVSEIKTAIESISFGEENKRLATPDRYVYIIQQEVAKKSDTSLYNYIGMQGSLYKAIFAVINKKNTIKPNIALPGLNIGVTTYASSVITLIQQLRYMSEYVYQKGDLKKFNNFYNRLIFDFNFFKLILNGSSRKQGILDQVIQILNDAKKSKSKQDLGDELFENIGRYITQLNQLKQKIAALSLNVLESTPDNNLDIDFNSRTGDQLSNTNFLDWKEGTKVSYAVQFEKDGKYSKVSDWTSPQDIMKKANPDIVFRKTSNMNRLVFRKFGNGEAELAYILPGSKSSFRDVHRDLYNLAFKNSLSEAEVESNMDRLIKLGADVKAVFEGKRTVIHAAAIAGRTVMLGKILEKEGSLINLQDKLGFTPLHLAAENKRTDFAQGLINRGANVNVQGQEYKVSPLHLAVRYHAEEIVKALLENSNINPNLKDIAGLTPLHYAVTDENYNKKLFTTLLTNRKTDLNVKDNNGLAVVHYATILNRWEEVVDLTFEGDRFDIYAKDNQQMLAVHYDAMKGYKNEQLISSMMADDKASKLNDAAGEKHWTPLHYAAFFKQTAWVKYLFHWHENVVSKINVDAKDVDDQTPLHLAAAAGLKEIVKELLANGAKVYEKTKKQNTPLDLAVMHNRKEVIDDLLTFENNQKLKNGKSAKENDTKACQLAKGEMLNLLKKKNRCGNFRRSNDDNSTNSPRKFAPIGMSENNSLRPLLISNKPKENLELKNINPLTQVDVNGALLLLDLFIRKMTNEKYNSAWIGSLSLLDARARALNITDNLQKIMEIAGNDGDLFDIHSKIYKAIMSGNDYKLVKEVCTYLNQYSTLEPQKVENIISAMVENKSFGITKNAIQGNLENLIAQACYRNNF
ncbi:alpha-latrocrustotoxin-Lt1a-like [Parasteatoda tepidariorum]|uniref:alpha-latrocrustotoxin-Lt1a-like n=1 Tax=Parasteatoda tepidariorum TaxID=114398 RepID=UPI001C71CB35|nr:delta-latroinsectotoxin-Lt1a-like [Parasteatoda tepidariorum]